MCQTAIINYKNDKWKNLQQGAWARPHSPAATADFQFSAHRYPISSYFGH